MDSRFKLHSKSFVRAARASLMVCASVLIALGLCEGLLRLFPSLLPEDAQLQLLWKQDDLKPQTIADPYLGFRYPIRRTLVHHTRDFAITIQTDEHGFRNKSPWPAAAPVVVVGDSLAFGYGVDDDKMWSRLLEREVRPNRIINISLPGFAPQQYVRYFKTFGVPLRPQLLILCVFPGNDVRDAKRFEAWEASGSPGSFATWQFISEHDADDASFAKPSSVMGKMRLLLTLKAIHANLRSRFQSETLDLPQGSVQLTPDMYEQRISTFDAADPGFRALTASVGSMKMLANQVGARLLVVLFPTKEEIYLPLMGSKFPDMVTPVERALRQMHVDVLDLSDGMRQQAQGPRPLFFTVDGHPNELGNAVIADLIEERLRENPQRFQIASALQGSGAAAYKK